MEEKLKKQNPEVSKTNKLWQEKFKKVPFQKRLLLISHCLRCIGICQEKRIKGKGLICLHCHKQCQVNQIVTEAKRLKYKKIYVISGGQVVESIIRKEKPGAIVAMACYYELSMGTELVKHLRKKLHLTMPLQIIELGLANCDSGSKINLEKVKKILAL